MKAVGLITEYNPLHNGHIYHLNSAMQLSKADVSIFVMSGNFVQRGAPAIVDKYRRAKAAVDSGINLVIELPSFYSLSSAESFASGAVRTLDALLCDNLCFGSECGDIEKLKNIANILCDEPFEFKKILKDGVSSGLSYPQARNDALNFYLKDDSINDVINEPNNILGIEYLKAIINTSSKIKPLTIIRQGASYHDNYTNEGMASASFLRKQIQNSCSTTNTVSEIVDILKSNIPDSMFNIIFEDNIIDYMNEDHFSLLFRYKMSEIIYRNNYSKENICNELTSYMDISPSIANRMLSTFNEYTTFSEYALKVKTKQYTYTRICRCMMHIILDMTIEKEIFYKKEHVPYIRILAFDEQGQQYLAQIRKKCEVPIITKVSTSKDLLSDDIHAAEIYNMIHYEIYKKESLINEFKKGIYIKNRKRGHLQ